MAPIGFILPSFPGAQMSLWLKEVGIFPPELMLVGTDSISGLKNPLPMLGLTSSPEKPKEPIQLPSDVPITQNPSADLRNEMKAWIWEQNSSKATRLSPREQCPGTCSLCPGGQVSSTPGVGDRQLCVGDIKPQ